VGGLWFDCANELISISTNDVAHIESTLQIIVTHGTPELTF
jgi:hypothetical protein